MGIEEFLIESRIYPHNKSLSHTKNFNGVEYFWLGAITGKKSILG